MFSEKTRVADPQSSKGGRITDIDILRGAAFLGVALVNVFDFAIPPDYMYDSNSLFSDLPNRAITHIVEWFLGGKFYPIFAFLFGLGFYIQYTHFKQRGQDHVTLMARRQLSVL